MLTCLNYEKQLTFEEHRITIPMPSHGFITVMNNNL